ncbi:GAF domain-containing protein [Pedobacter gandavensis]|uniref:GAF domain-containing protein n=1 Tax=Pedobacter gandavensis TaxID=2679963 RepID=A0ABR6EWV4_9SPHI|nr:GAF domain-containing protein [Pedobacter gandavensis]MBB2149765.1 GAF domain-containing protein [Pedobacter gandavensis]
MENNTGGVLISSNEEARLENLKKYKILYTKTEPYFDQLAAITATMMNTPIAMINFVDRDIVWTKADQHGQAGKEMDRELSLCSLAILNESVTVFEDLIQDPTMMSNPLFVGESGLRFYAAAAITTNEGFRVGSVCIVDKNPRVFGEEERKKLERMALMVRLEMNRRIGIS